MHAGRSLVAEAIAPVKASPAIASVSLYLRLILALDVLFVVVYGGCNWLSARRHDLIRAYLPVELAFPFVPWLVYAYFSIVLLFVLPLAALDDAGMRRLARRIAAGILASGCVYLLFPARLGFERPARVPGYEAIFRPLYALDLPHNLVPSLHVVYSALILAALGAGRPAWLRLGLGTWLAVICVAVVLVHQHHLADVAAGLLLAGFIERKVS
jgi:membrane-associated phospholipid phosphatase